MRAVPVVDRKHGEDPRVEGGDVVLSARGISKAYPGIQALGGVDLELRAGEVHGLVGENGAGKSTLVKILSGAVEPDSGELVVHGRLVSRFDPRTAQRAGVAVVHQEPHVVPALSPVANVFLGQAVTKLGMLDEGAMRRRFLAWTRELGVELPTKGATGGLSVAAQQTIEIIRAMEQGAQVVLMDEPTASLGEEERAGLFRMIDAMLERGTALVYVSHKLEDVLRLAARVTVLRDGVRVSSVRAAEASVESLVRSMLDDDLGQALAKRRHRVVEGPDVLGVTSLSVPGAVSELRIDVRAGEIVGVAGLVGSGRSTLLRAIGGAEPAATGSMVVEGRAIPWPRSPRRAHRHGIVLVPEDRRTEGLVMSLSAWENLALPSLGTVHRRGFSSRRRLMAAAATEAAKVGYDPERLPAVAGHLSGGNQQKLVLGKLLPLRPKVLLVDEPTRGIDVGAKAEIFRLLQGLADAGSAVVLVSEEIEELLALADRVVALCEGKVSGVFAGPQLDADEILTAMLPVGRRHAS